MRKGALDDPKVCRFLGVELDRRIELGHRKSAIRDSQLDEFTGGSMVLFGGREEDGEGGENPAPLLALLTYLMNYAS